MLSIEQASNIHHLVDRVLDTGVPGAFVELGCYTGSSAALISGLLEPPGAQREFHVYDRFDIELGKQQNIHEVFKNTIHAEGVPMPIIHVGDFLQTVPTDLPEVIAFAHLDCGTGGSAEEHAALITHCLEGVYPRLAQGAVVLLMDYHRAGATLDGCNSNPGVRMACDAFFLDKPEQIQSFYMMALAPMHLSANDDLGQCVGSPIHLHAQERREDAGSRHGPGYVPHFLQFGFQGVRPFQY
ncbi:MAG: hypothetical protein IPI05_13580 [Flavobacteriales bacterium]|nr:hypothetical protein [Flavobacteriales bacterium]